MAVHADQAPKINYTLDRSRHQQLHFATWLPPAEGTPQLDYSQQHYRNSAGGTVFTNDPSLKATVATLNSRWPWTTSWPDLIETVQRRLGDAGVAAPADLPKRVDSLLELLIHGGHVAYRREPVTAPPASPLIRLDEPSRRMAAVTTGAHSCTVNPWHEVLTLTPVDGYLLPLLDGTRDRNALIEALLAAATQGLIQFDGTSTPRAAATAYLDELPRRLATMKLNYTVEARTE